MADTRSKQLWSQVLVKLPREATPQLIKPFHIYNALSEAQRDVCLDTLCLDDEIVVDLEAGEERYPAASNIHRITNFTLPVSWSKPLTAVEPKEWPGILNKHLTGTQPLYVTIIRGEFRFAPAPTVSDELTVWVALKPAEDGGDDISETSGPITPPAFDEALVFGAMKRLVQNLPKDMLLDPNKDTEYYDSMYRDLVADQGAKLRQVQMQQPMSKREDFRF